MIKTHQLKRDCQSGLKDQTVYMLVIRNVLKKINILKVKGQGLPWGPAARTPPSQGRGSGFDPWL